MGIAKDRDGDRLGALECFEEAKRIQIRTGTLETPSGAALLRSLGLAKGQNGDFQGESEAFKEALRIRELTGTLETRGGAALMRDIGVSNLAEFTHF